MNRQESIYLSIALLRLAAIQIYFSSYGLFERHAVKVFSFLLIGFIASVINAFSNTVFHNCKRFLHPI